MYIMYIKYMYICIFLPVRMRSWELDEMILVDPFQLGIFYGSMIL